MTNAVIECILSRSAAKYYDPAVTLSDDQIRELVRIGTTARGAHGRATLGHKDVAGRIILAPERPHRPQLLS